jgi:hypothetical protein
MRVYEVYAGLWGLLRFMRVYEVYAGLWGLDGGAKFKRLETFAAYFAKKLLVGAEIVMFAVEIYVK